MKRVDVDTYTKMLIVTFRFLKRDKDEAIKTEKRIQTLPNKTYSRGLKAWFVCPDDHNIKKLWKWGFIFPDDWSYQATGVPIYDDICPYNHIRIPKYLKFLRPYQKTAIQFLDYVDGRGLIADDMGIGKTIEALGWILWTLTEGPALIVIPTSTKPQWKREYIKWVDTNVTVLYGKTSHPLNKQSYIINWEILQYWEKELSMVDFQTLVADECQFAGNPKAKRTKALKRLSREITYFLPMSGTPINSKTRQFFTILNLLDPIEFPSEWKFLHRYCDPKHNGFSMTYDGSSHSEELFHKISKLMIRRGKREVLKDLPPLFEDVIPLDIGNSIKKCKKLEQHFFDTYEAHSTPKIQIEQEFHSLKLEIFDWKLPAVTSWIDDFLTSGKKLLVGAWHHYVIDTLFEKYKSRAVKITGKITGKNREKALETFYNKVDILFIQIKAGGIGLDGLQNVCSNAVVVELADTPTIMDQFKSRLERSGQVEPINFHYLVAKDTIEEDLLESLDIVRNNIHGVMEGKTVEDTDLLSVMFNRRIDEDL